MEEDEKLILFGHNYLQAQFAQEVSHRLSKGATIKDVIHTLAKHKRRIQVFMSILVKDNPKAQEIERAIALQNKQIPLLPSSGEDREDALFSIVMTRKAFLVAMKPSLPQSDTLVAILDRNKRDAFESAKPKCIKSIKSK